MDIAELAIGIGVALTCCFFIGLFVYLALYYAGLVKIPASQVRKDQQVYEYTFDGKTYTYTAYDVGQLPAGFASMMPSIGVVYIDRAHPGNVVDDGEWPGPYDDICGYGFGALALLVLLSFVAWRIYGLIVGKQQSFGILRILSVAFIVFVCGYVGSWFLVYPFFYPIPVTQN